MASRDPINDYRDLVAWQRAIDLAVLVDAICDRLPRKHWDLAQQMRRAANSVHSNIAEGNGRASVRDYLRHLSMSSASLNELESDLYFLSRKYGEKSEANNALKLVVDVRKPLLGLVRSLRRKRDENE